MSEHFFTTYVRTKTLFKHRLKDLADYNSVKIYLYELNKLGVNHGPLLFSLKQRGEIDYDANGNFRALREGPVDPSLLERGRKKPKVSLPLTPLHLYMRQQLLYVSVAPNVDFAKLPVYFKAFLEHRDRQLPSFFTVDEFAGRVHTPVVNLKGDLRKHLRLHGRPIVSLDVKQMQPTILAKCLVNAIGKNPFSTAIFNGEDVYVVLQKAAGYKTRPEAKKCLFQLIFGKPMNDIGSVFGGDTSWVDWINAYKSRREPKNPHGKNEFHTNLAWLLQYSEVQVMTDIWTALMRRSIPFLTIHDDVLCMDKDKDVVFRIMEKELKLHFDSFEIVVDHHVS